MSLRAKLEAVIYAAEEPVTLTQLAALFAPDALEWKAEQEAKAAAAAAEAAPPNPEPLPMMVEGLEYLGLEPSPAPDSEQAPQPAGEGAEAGVTPGPEAGAEIAAPAAEAAGTGVESAGSAADVEPEAASTETPLDAEGEIKRLARQRDREVKAILRQLLDELITSYDADARGVEIREIAGGYRMATKPECHDAVRLFIKSLKPAMKLSLPALETLAVIAYKQPVTAPEVNEIRGVESSGVFGSLLARKLITTAGRKQVIGRPILYKTTREFLLRFGLKDISELPSMDEFEKMAAIELDEEASAEEPDTTDAGGPEIKGGVELDESAPEEPEEKAAEDAVTAAPVTATEEPVPTVEEEHVEPASNEAAPAEPPPLEEQAETEMIPHD